LFSIQVPEFKHGLLISQIFSLEEQFIPKFPGGQLFIGTQPCKPSKDKRSFSQANTID
jgi:hypothetical protein